MHYLHSIRFKYSGMVSVRIQSHKNSKQKKNQIDLQQWNGQSFFFLLLLVIVDWNYIFFLNIEKLHSDLKLLLLLLMMIIIDDYDEKWVNQSQFRLRSSHTFMHFLNDFSFILLHNFIFFFFKSIRFESFFL